MAGFFGFEDEVKRVIGAGRLPKPRVSPEPTFVALSLAYKGFETNLGDLEKRILSVQNELAKYKNILQQYANIVEGSDFDLDEKKTEDKKKIDTAKQIAKKSLGEQIRLVDGRICQMVALDKTITNLKGVAKAAQCGL